MPTTRIFIDKNGKIIIEGVDYADDRCLQDLQRLLETLKRLGVHADVEQQMLKPEAVVRSVARAEEAARTT